MAPLRNAAIFLPTLPGAYAANFTGRRTPATLARLDLHLSSWLPNTCITLTPLRFSFTTWCMISPYPCPTLLAYLLWTPILPTFCSAFYRYTDLPLPITLRFLSRSCHRAVAMAKEHNLASIHPSDTSLFREHCIHSISITILQTLFPSGGR